MQNGIVVKKFGGTSLGSVSRIRNAAARILARHQAGEKIVVVASAMSGETQRLENMIYEVTKSSSAASDMVLSSGEQVSVGLLALTLDQMAGRSIACPLLAHQAVIATKKNAAFGDADIHAVNKDFIQSKLNKGQIVVLPGYQCYDGFYTHTMGRGGSDTSAVVLAGLLGADVCKILTDVDGVYTADPRKFPDAKKFKTISTASMANLSRNGAKVMHPKSVMAIDQFKVPVEVALSSDSKVEGTRIIPAEPPGEPRLYFDGITVTDVQKAAEPLAQVNLLGRGWRDSKSFLNTLHQEFLSPDYGVKAMFPINEGLGFSIAKDGAINFGLHLHRRFNQHIGPEVGV